MKDLKEKPEPREELYDEVTRLIKKRVADGQIGKEMAVFVAGCVMVRLAKVTSVSLGDMLKLFGEAYENV